MCGLPPDGICLQQVWEKQGKALTPGDVHLPLALPLKRRRLRSLLLPTL